MSFDKIVYKLTDKRIPSATGIGLVGDILNRAGFQEQFRNVGSENKRSRKQIDCGAVMTTFIGLLCMGKPDYDAIAEFQNDAAYYQTALHLTKGFPHLPLFDREWMRLEKNNVKNFCGLMHIC